MEARQWAMSNLSLTDGKRQLILNCHHPFHITLVMIFAPIAPKARWIKSLIKSKVTTNENE